ncbi:tetratricopeptide repeat protein [Marinobacterium maritimum]
MASWVSVLLFIIPLMLLLFGLMHFIESRRKPMLHQGVLGKLHDEQLFVRWDETSAYGYKRFDKLKRAWQSLEDNEAWYQYNLSKAGFTVIAPGARSAFRWYSRDWGKRQNPESAYYLAMMALAGLGTERDAGKAWEWLKEAGQGNIANVLTAQGIMQLRGRPVAGDPSWPVVTVTGDSRRAAVALFQQASEAGDPLACQNFGFCFEHGIGVEANLETAISYYLVAAEQEMTASQYRLSMLYEKLGELSDAYVWSHVAAQCAESEIADNRSQRLFDLLPEQEREWARLSASASTQRILGPRMARLYAASRLIRSI